MLDCQGRVVAVVSNLFTQTMQFLSNAIRISTAWGQANVASVPVQVLKELPWPSDERGNGGHPDRRPPLCIEFFSRD